MKVEISLFKEIIERALDAIWVVNENGLIECSNPFCEKLTGYDSNELNGSEFKKLIAQDSTKDSLIDSIMDHSLKVSNELVNSIFSTGTREFTLRTKDNQIIRGAYHFFIGSKDGRMQAENFIDKVELEPGDMPPVLDAEQLNGATAVQLRKEMRKWLEIVENHYGVKPIIYTNVDFYERNLGSEFDGYPLWAAHYYQPGKPRINRGWVFWQHSDEGRVNGIVSKVDFNVFNGDSADFKNLLIE